jgi:hypothetical protein
MNPDDKSKNELTRIVQHEVEYLVRHASHPPIHIDIDAVWVFSGPGTFFTPLDPGEPAHFAWMDRYRILYGLSIVRKITAKRLQKSFEAITRHDILEHGPLFIYNGNPEENAALRKAFSGAGHSMPQEKIIIVDNVEKENISVPIQNTLDQVESFPTKLIGREIRHRIAVVSHAAHLSRILRYLEEYQIFPDNIVVELFPVKDSEKNTMLDTKEETDKIWEYFQKGDLSWNPFPTEV